MIFPNPIRISSGDEPYHDCKWCQGRGCLACAQERKMAYDDAFPQGPKPLASVSYDDEQGMKDLAAIMGAEGLEQAAAEAKQRVENLTGLSLVLLKVGDSAGPHYRNELIAQETGKILTEKLAALGDRKRTEGDQ